MLFETLCRKSFLMLATRACNLVIRAFAFRQFFENFFLRAKRRSNFANLGRNFLKGWHGSMTSPSDSVCEVSDAPVHTDCGYRRMLRRPNLPLRLDADEPLAARLRDGDVLRFAQHLLFGCFA